MARIGGSPHFSLLHDFNHRLSGRLLKLLRLLQGFFNRPDHVEGLFGKVVVFPLHDLFEGADRLGHLNGFAGETGELLGDEERLRKEVLDLSGPCHRGLCMV